MAAIEAARPRALVRLGRRLRVSVALLAALAAAFAISACGSSSTNTTASVPTNLNTARVVRAIQESMLAKRHHHYQVTCPSLVPQEQGRTFECVASRRLKKHKTASTAFLATIENNRGYVTYVGK